LNNAINLIVNGIFTLCAIAMRVIGSLDNAIGNIMTSAGIDPQRQVLVLLVVTVVLVVLALRLLGGLLGWLVLLLLILLLLHRVMPGVLGPDQFIPGQGQTQTSL
jgi:hypothetical protein